MCIWYYLAGGGWGEDYLAGGFGETEISNVCLCACVAGCVCLFVKCLGAHIDDI